MASGNASHSRVRWPLSQAAESTFGTPEWPADLPVPQALLELDVESPEAVTGAVDAAAYRSLAVRDLLRGETTELPSGEAVAQLMGVPQLSDDDLEQTWPHGTPLWFYILKEAERRAGGDRLGPVGGRIVAEVLIGLLRADPASYLSLEPGWEPSLSAAGPRFGLADLLTLGDR